MEVFMKKIKFLIFGLLFSIIGLFSSCSFSSSKYTFIEEPQLSVDYSEYLGYTAYVNGTLKNNSLTDWDYVQVEFSIYDSNG